MKVYTLIGPIIGIMLLIFLIIWFVKSKTKLRKLVVILTGLALISFGLILNRIENYDSKQSLILNDNNLNILEKTELANSLNLDLGLIIYSVIFCVTIIIISYLEVNNKNLQQHRV